MICGKELLDYVLHSEYARERLYLPYMVPTAPSRRGKARLRNHIPQTESRGERQRVHGHIVPRRTSLATSDSVST